MAWQIIALKTTTRIKATKPRDSAMVMGPLRAASEGVAVVFIISFSLPGCI
jgi:hypothetical protein